jgi:hypothetical protein
VRLQIPRRSKNAEKLKHLGPCVTLSEPPAHTLPFLIKIVFIDAAEVLNLQRLGLAKAIGDDPQPVASPVSASTTEFQRRQKVASAELCHEKAMIENVTIVALIANHFERRTVPDEVIDRLHPGLLFLFCSVNVALRTCVLVFERALQPAFRIGPSGASGGGRASR